MTAVVGADGADIAVRVLGPLEVELAGALVPLSAPKERALVVALALRPGRPVAVHELLVALWGERAPSTARKCVQVHVSRLRRRLEQEGVTDGAALLVHAGDGYVLAVEPGIVDAHRFERLISDGRRAVAAGEPDRGEAMLLEALGLWRAPPLPELADGPLGQGEIARLSELRMSAIEELNEARLAAGQHDHLAAQIEATLAEEPLRERLWRQLMVALYRSGRQGDALRAYQRARSMLVDQLGIEPGPELRRIEAAIVAQDAGLDLGPVPSAMVAAVAGVDRGVAQNGDRPGMVAERGSETIVDRAAHVAWAQRLRRYPFFGRSEERQCLTRAWRNASTWGVTVALVSGEEGVGKTRLMAEAVVSFAEEGSLVLSGRCDEGAARPFLPIREAVDRYVEHAGADRAHIVARLPAALLSLSPDLAEQIGLTPGPPTDDPYEVAMGLVTLARHESTNGPMVLMIDDLHLAAPSTLRVVRHLLDHDPESPLLILLTYRDSEIQDHGELLDLLADLHRYPGHERITLTGLSGDEGVALLAARLGRQPEDGSRLAMATLCQEAAGNPLYLLELARHVIECGAVDSEGHWRASGVGRLGLPTSVRDQVLRRVRVLSPKHRMVLATGAVAGPVFHIDLVTAVAGVSEHTAIAALERATSARLVREADDEAGCYAFASAVLRLAVYDDLSLTHRARLHQRIGEVLAAAEAGRYLSDEDMLSAVTDHFAMAQSHPRHLSAGLAPPLGQDPIDEFGRERYASAYEDAVRQIEPGAPVGKDDDASVTDGTRWCVLLLGMAESRWRSGDLAAARELFERAADEARSIDRPDLLTRSAAGFARVVVRLGVAHPPVIDLLHEARANLEADDPLQIEIRAALVPELVWAGRWSEAVRVSKTIG